MRPLTVPAAALGAALLGFGPGCRGVRESQARTLIQGFNDVVSEAYRRGDVRLIDGVVGQDSVEGRRLTGLIGVRQDMGITLDAHLESLDITKIDQGKETLEIRTRERWRYRDLRIGTGEQVGQASEDAYEMAYVLKKEAGVWKVVETKFAAPPQVGRQVTPWEMDARDAHAMITSPPQEKK